MTERLAQLMRAEVDHLDVPAPNPSAVLARGHGLRRRRRLTAGAGAFAAIAVIAGSAVGVNAIAGGDDSDGKAEPAAALDSQEIFSIGSTVYIPDDGVVAKIDDKAIKSLYYTSAGVLVRHGDNSWSDGGGPQRFSLVRPDGTVERIDVTTEETVHSTDATQPYLAYAEETESGVDVVVHDVRDNTEAARVEIAGPFDQDAWMPPPVSLSGDSVYVTTSPTAYAVNWRTGDVTETDAVEPGGFVSIHGGRQTDEVDGRATVVDAATSEVLLDATMTKNQWGGFQLSPDGRYALLSVEDMMSTEKTASTVDVYDVESGEKVSIPRDNYGWTVDGHLFSVSKHELTTCEATTGQCTTVEHGIQMPPKAPHEEICEEMQMIPEGGGEPVSAGTECYMVGGETWEGQLKLGGRTYES